MRTNYDQILNATPKQNISETDMIFNPTSTVDCHIKTTRNHQLSAIDDGCGNLLRFTYDYSLGNLVYMKNTGIYYNRDNKNRGLHSITYMIRKYYHLVTMKMYQ